MKLTMTMTISVALLACTLPATAHEEAKHPRKVLAMEQKDWGIAGNTAAITRTIEIRMADNMRFTPERVEVRHGETVKLVVMNGGQMLHELVLGTKHELDAHSAVMMKFPGMEHDEAHMVHVKPAKSEPLVWNFNRAGEFQFGCLLPGHYEAGMVGTIVVLPSSNQGSKS